MKINAYTIFLIVCHILSAFVIAEVITTIIKQF